MLFFFKDDGIGLITVGEGILFSSGSGILKQLPLVKDGGALLCDVYHLMRGLALGALSSVLLIIYCPLSLGLVLLIAYMLCPQ